MSFGPYDADGHRKYLTQGESDRFLKAARGLALEPQCFCLTLYYSGCRISEALNLTRHDIDWESQVIRFRTLKKREKKETRRVPFPPKLSSPLRRLTDQQTEDQLWNYSRTTAWRLIKQVMKQSQISGAQASPKGLRHGFGVRATMENVPTHIVRDWMGHAFPATTEIYLDVRDAEEMELIKRTWKS